LLLQITNADAIHPGYGFFLKIQFSKFVRNTELNLLDFSEMIDQNDKASAKSTMIEAGVPWFLVQ
jgi:acetyl/propionyl-CoA carboxylase alpha subunit